MNLKRYLAACLALFIYIYLFESFVHGSLLRSLYSETPTLWRNYQQMQTLVPFNLLIMALLALWLSFIFTRLFSKGGWKNGLNFGFYFGLLSGLQAAGAFYYLPISATLALAWFAANAIESLLGGILIGFIYRKN